MAEGIARYRLQLTRLNPETDAAAADFSNPLADRSDLAAGAHEEALAPGRYAWRVASVRGDGDQGPFGDPLPFTLRPLPAAPVLQEPQVSDNALVLRWPAGEPGALRVHPESARHRSGGERVFDPERHLLDAEERMAQLDRGVVAGGGDAGCPIRT